MVPKADLGVKAGESGCQVVIPPKRSRKILRNYDRAFCKVRHLFANAFPHLKRCGELLQRCASFLVAVQIRYISLRVNII